MEQPAQTKDEMICRWIKFQRWMKARGWGEKGEEGKCRVRSKCSKYGEERRVVGMCLGTGGPNKGPEKEGKPEIEMRSTLRRIKKKQLLRCTIPVRTEVTSSAWVFTTGSPLLRLLTFQSACNNK